jgi:DNA-binding response OmpR family regulator
MFSRLDQSSGAQAQSAVLMLVGVDPLDPLSYIFPPHVFRTSATRSIPWIALLENNYPEHRRTALEAGANDCIVKPFSARELLLCIQAVLRSPGTPDTATNLQADIVIDSWAMKLLVRGAEIPTTALEFRLVEYLARHRGQVFTRDFLLDAVWGDMRFINPRSVDACIRRVREKLEPDRTKPTMLKTIRGVGYRLDAVTEWQSAPNSGCNCPACKSREGGLSWQPANKQRRPSVET